MPSELEARDPYEDARTAFHLRVVANKTSLLVEIRVAAPTVILTAVISGLGWTIIDVLRSHT